MLSGVSISTNAAGAKACNFGKGKISGVNFAIHTECVMSYLR